jgi:hypothetical protein
MKCTYGEGKKHNPSPISGFLMGEAGWGLAQ